MGVASRLGLLPTAIYVSLTARVNVDIHDSHCNKATGRVRDVDHHVWPFWCPRAVPPLEPC